MNFLDHITFRKPNKTNKTRSIDLSSEENSTNNSLVDGSTSMPNISEDENTTTIQELKQQINALTSKLYKAQEEINTLSIENRELKSTIHDLRNKNDSKIENTTTSHADVSLSSNNRLQQRATNNEQAQCTSTPLKQRTTLPTNSTKTTRSTASQKEKQNIESQKNKICINLMSF
ncbi:hypothetical protein B5X24_HaOG206113 [Helicoverpa armigera]|uniref:Uncharacterized protein n=1 Tax=Helicoverpa armigera TaxID=29058 RepID=A0A2W1BUG4_HELAM|nr:hypothetical protein B5X24_HaOG206113 [Helicoverpa armigera]